MPAVPTCPLKRSQVVDRYFLEHRAKLLDLAAFLDRLDRSSADAASDHRLVALLDAIPLLIDSKPERARRILELFSDHTASPIAAAGVKGATGVDPAYRPQPRPIADDEDLNLL